MRPAQRRRPVPVLAALLALATFTGSSLANAQPVGSSVSQPDAWAWTPGVEETTPANDESTAEGPSQPAGQRPQSPSAFPKMALLDAGHVLSSPARWQGREWLILSASAAALATLSLADETLSDAARDRGPTFGSVGDALNEFGSAGSLLVLGGFYLAGAIGDDSKAKAVCLDGVVASLIATGMITPVLSTFIGRERPTEENGAFSFKPFDGRSFPSGHATQAFAVATVIATSYDQLWVKATVYGAATMTAWGRVRRGKHFPTDVVAGAAIGTLVGGSVVHFNRKLRLGEKEPEITGARLTILPLVSGGTYGVSVILDF